MFSEEARYKSFTPPNTSKGSRKTTTATINNQWPHPIHSDSTNKIHYPTPSQLSIAGFYFSPTPTEQDRCLHFLNPNIHVSDWEKGQDPFQTLLELDPENPWSLIQQSKDHSREEGNVKMTDVKKSGRGRPPKHQSTTTVYTFDDIRLLPNGRDMIQARLETFGKEWIYDGKKGWKCTSKEVSSECRQPSASLLG